MRMLYSTASELAFEQTLSRRPVNFFISSKDADRFINPCVEQFLKQLDIMEEDAKNDGNTKLKASEPIDIFDSFIILQDLIKIKYNQSIKEHSLEDYTMAALEFIC